MREGSVFEVPANVSDGAALALPVHGLTAYHLLRTPARLAAGESVVVHAAAGGVGSLAVQLAKRWDAGRVIAVASTPAKRELALSLGADVAVDSNASDLTTALREANGGAKVDVVLEMVGGTTFDASLRALGTFGRLVTFGTASRQEPTPVNPSALMVGSKSIIGFWLVNAMSGRRAATMVARPLRELVTMAAQGQLKPQVGRAYPLADARRAHEDMRARTTTGKVILTP